jgi:hypothetical protein
MPTMMPTRTTPAARPEPSRSRRLRVVAAVVTATAVGTAGVALPQGAGAVPPGGAKDQSNGAKVTVRATKVKAGGKIKVSGSNWKSKGSRVQKGAQVTVKLDDSTIVAVLPIKKKKFSGTVTIPKQVKAGSHWLRFLAADPATSIKSHTFKVTK